MAHETQTRERSTGIGIGEIVTSIIPKPILHGATRFLDRIIGERHSVEICRHSLSMNLGPDAPDSVRVALLSDFHYDPLCEAEFVTRCVQMANQEKPDLIFLLGDFVSKNARKIGEIADILAHLQAPTPRFAVLGNHDYIAGPENVAQALKKRQIQVLRNEIQRVEVNGGQLTIAGTDCVSMKQEDPQILDSLSSEERALVLCHEPDFFAHLSRKPQLALQVSGHSHGGQIRAPFLQRLVLPKHGRRWFRGLHQRNGSALYVNRGIGTGHIHLRFKARPEITILDLEHNAA